MGKIKSAYYEDIELYGKPQSEIDCDLQSDQTKLGWESLFVIADWLVKRIEKIPWNPVRSFAIKKAERRPSSFKS